MPTGNQTDSVSHSDKMLDVVAKSVTIAAGMIYLLGYIVIARRMATYGLPATELVNAQYLVAGMLPALLVAITAIVVLWAYRYRPGPAARAEKIVVIMIGMLFLVLLSAELADPSLSRRNVHVFNPQGTVDTYVFTLLRVILGEAALWYLIVIVRSGFVGKMREWYRARGRDPDDFWILPIFLGVMAAVIIFFAFGRAMRIYARIPQAYGGARPLNIRLYGERTKLPPDLFPRDSGQAATPLAYSAPLELLLQSPNVLIVRPVGDTSRRVWAVDPQTVLATLSTTSK